MGWNADQIRLELDQFFASRWGACLDDAARTGLTALLLPAGAPAGDATYNGYSGIAFLNRVLDPASMPDRAHVAVDALRAVPIALRAWVRFNRRVSSSADAILTLALLEHIDELEPRWQAAVDLVDLLGQAPLPDADDAS
ncbi:MAG TPA: hypothetical protein VIY72_02715 [Acidimicrobiales bacterium]